MADSIAVHPDGVGALAGELTGLADRLAAEGTALHDLERPRLGGSISATELVDTLTANVSSMAASVLACEAALRGLARVARVAEVGYRTTEQQVAARWAALAAAFDDIHDAPVQWSSPTGSRPAG